MEKEEEKEKARERKRDGGARCWLFAEKDIGARGPSNLLRCPRAPFNETRLMQHIDHLGMH